MNKLTDKQDGTVMIISMIFLLLISLVATTAAETNSLQLKMAGNDQLRADAQQRVMAILDAILDDNQNTPVVGNVGYKICETGSSDSSCNQASISLSTAVTAVPSGTSKEFFVTRIGPLETGVPVMSETTVSSASAYSLARYEISAGFKGEAARLGNSTIAQGVSVKIPARNI